MALFGELGTARFLARHWQREPLLVRAALPEACGALDGDTLAGLACEEGVDARIVVHDAERDAWTCEHGPFEPARFETLPETGWTLLVQAVDQWLPEVSALLERFDFLPRWRIDDAMFSYAAPYGGVGPHFDGYDVFLVQICGERRWRLGQRCDAATPVREHPELRLIEHLDTIEEHLLGPGDMLYLPAGVAHQGDAAGAECITCSIGFRAPSHRELLTEALAGIAASLPEEGRYRDPPCHGQGHGHGHGGDQGALAGADRCSLDGVDAAGLADAWRVLDEATIEAALVDAFGALVTAPRHPELIEPVEPPPTPVLAAQLARDGALSLVHHSASRFAYRTLGTRAALFVDGERHETGAVLAREICAGRLEADPGPDGWRLVAALIEQGSLEPG